MVGIIVLFPKPSDARNIRNVLVRSGIEVTAVCTTGNQVIGRIEDWEDGLIVCGYKFADMMMYHELFTYLPKSFEMLVITSRVHQEEVLSDNIDCLPMPIKIYNLIDRVQNMLSAIEKRKKKQRRKKFERSPEEKAIIEKAKALLMQNSGLTEAQAHEYLQKRSMDSGMNMIDTANIILDSY